MKNKFKCSDISFMHNHTLDETLHQIYGFFSKIGIQRKNEVSHSIKALERPSKRKKVTQTDQSFQRISNPNQVGTRVVSPIK